MNQNVYEWMSPGVDEVDEVLDAPATVTEKNTKNRVPYTKIGLAFLVGIFALAAFVMTVVGFLFFDETKTTPIYQDISVAPPALLLNPAEAWLSSLSSLRLNIQTAVLQGPTSVFYWTPTDPTLTPVTTEFTEPGMVAFVDSTGFPLHLRPQGFATITIDSTGLQMLSSTPNGYSQILLYSRTLRSGFEKNKDATVYIRPPHDCQAASDTFPFASRVCPWLSLDGLELFVSHESPDGQPFRLVRGHVAVYSRQPDSATGYSSTSSDWNYECPAGNQLRLPLSAPQLGLIRPRDPVTGSLMTSDGYGSSVYGFSATNGTRLLLVSSVYPAQLHMYKKNDGVYTIHRSFSLTGRLYSACSTWLLVVRDGRTLQALPLRVDGSVDSDIQLVLQLGVNPTSIWIHPKGQLFIVGYAGRIELFQWSVPEQTWIQMNTVTSPSSTTSSTFGYFVTADPTGQVVGIAAPCTTDPTRPLSVVSNLTNLSAWFIYTCQADSADPKAILSSRSIYLEQTSSLVSDGFNFSPDPLLDLHLRIDNQGESILAVLASPLNQTIQFYSIVSL